MCMQQTPLPMEINAEHAAETSADAAHPYRGDNSPRGRGAQGRKTGPASRDAPVRPAGDAELLFPLISLAY